MLPDALPAVGDRVSFVTQSGEYVIEGFEAERWGIAGVRGLDKRAVELRRVGKGYRIQEIAPVLMSPGETSDDWRELLLAIL